jgi:hypothetical protein
MLVWRKLTSLQQSLSASNEGTAMVTKTFVANRIMDADDFRSCVIAKWTKDNDSRVYESLEPSVFHGPSGSFWLFLCLFEVSLGPPVSFPGLSWLSQPSWLPWPLLARQFPAALPMALAVSLAVFIVIVISLDPQGSSAYPGPFWLRLRNFSRLLSPPGSFWLILGFTRASPI